MTVMKASAKNMKGRYGDTTSKRPPDGIASAM